ncbi:uncharacterized protein F5891DRAFT_1059087 [Suillus fuscotomentosus]|uniref:Uncharacterized protein n=1 Tax=Suillus fuscotomentosus TaxID=1912939 RepID=A0AAD4DWF1_9AGAM|nr:uncharacterized protein F5891DRAFT_1059087 [Suillus fuscotomentosus]KAG1895371.1 hypothetical protein F5891DRAFT_1059087 [Suillus fuscotomentosus]
MLTMEKLPGPRSTWVNLFIVEVFLCLSSATVCYIFSISGPRARLRLCGIPLTPHRSGSSMHLWLSFFAYRSAGLLMTSTVSYHVGEACNILHGLIPNSSIETDPKMTRSPTHAKKLTRQEHGIFSHHVRVKLSRTCQMSFKARLRRRLVLRRWCLCSTSR